MVYASHGMDVSMSSALTATMVPASAAAAMMADVSASAA